jgi:hypothetical protein
MNSNSTELKWYDISFSKNSSTDIHRSCQLSFYVFVQWSITFIVHVNFHIIRWFHSNDQYHSSSFQFSLFVDFVPMISMINTILLLFNSFPLVSDSNWNFFFFLFEDWFRLVRKISIQIKNFSIFSIKLIMNNGIWRNVIGWNSFEHLNMYSIEIIGNFIEINLVDWIEKDHSIKEDEDKIKRKRYNEWISIVQRKNS